MKHRVKLTQTVTEEATVEVEAEDDQDAAFLALEKANNGRVEWHFLETEEEVQIVKITSEQPFTVHWHPARGGDWSSFWLPMQHVVGVAVINPPSQDWVYLIGFPNNLLKRKE
jgi:hypothetical protein